MGQIYAEGASTQTTGLPVVAPKSVQSGSEYIWEYWTPPITFSVLSADQVAGFIRGLLDLERYIKENAPGTKKPPVKFTGIMIDTDTGNIWIRGVVQPVPVGDIEVQQAGVNPMALAIMIGSLFALIGAAVSLRYVYEVFVDPYEPPGGLDPCTNPGVLNYIKCKARQSRWFLTGVLVGAVAITIVLLIKFGPKAGTQ